MCDGTEKQQEMDRGMVNCLGSKERVIRLGMGLEKQLGCIDQSSCWGLVKRLDCIDRSSCLDWEKQHDTWQRWAKRVHYTWLLD